MKHYHRKISFAGAGLVGVIIALLLNPERFEQRYNTNTEELFSNILVTDGDTIRSGSEIIRLWGIDAPELHQICYAKEKEQACGQEAKKELQEIFKLNKVSCTKIDTDRYRRSVSRCSVQSGDVGQLMVTRGWALDYEQYSKGYYKQWQNEAKHEKRGIWSLSFTKPWEWRKGMRVYK